VLSRSKVLATTPYDAAIAAAKASGFDTARLVATTQR